MTREKGGSKKEVERDRDRDRDRQRESLTEANVHFAYWLCLIPNALQQCCVRPLTTRTSRALSLALKARAVSLIPPFTNEHLTDQKTRRALITTGRL